MFFLASFAFAQAQTVDVHVHGVEGSGQVGCALFTSSDGFPGDDTKAQAAMLVDASTARDGMVVCRFEGIAAGRIAVTVMHDRDSNGKLNTNWLGLPREPYGFTNDADLRTFGPPRFEDAVVARASQVHINLHK